MKHKNLKNHIELNKAPHSSQSNIKHKSKKIGRIILQLFSNSLTYLFKKYCSRSATRTAIEKIKYVNDIDETKPNFYTRIENTLQNSISNYNLKTTRYEKSLLQRKAASLAVIIQITTPASQTTKLQKGRNYF